MKKCEACEKRREEITRELLNGTEPIWVCQDCKRAI